MAFCVLFLFMYTIKLVFVTSKSDTISVSNVKPKISEFMAPTTFFLSFSILNPTTIRFYNRPEYIFQLCLQEKDAKD